MSDPQVDHRCDRFITNQRQQLKAKQKKAGSNQTSTDYYRYYDDLAATKEELEKTREELKSRDEKLMQANMRIDELERVIQRSEEILLEVEERCKAVRKQRS